MKQIETSEGEQKEDDTVKPNIIFLQLESFFDPELVNFLNISEDPIPYYRQLMKDYSSGYLRVPVVGAGTANTEFETISGMSLRYFGAGEYPYKSVLSEETCESAPYVLKNLGYATHAIHNNEANFYSRRSVFSRLGFDTFTSEEYMPDISDVTATGWVKDHILTKEIIKTLDATDEPDYIYTISVQGHGDYPTEPVRDDPDVLQAEVTLTTEEPPAFILARSMGKIDTLYVHNGDTVKAGEHLGVIQNASVTEDILWLTDRMKEWGIAGYEPAKGAEYFIGKRLQLGELQSAYASFMIALSDYVRFIQQ